MISDPFVTGLNDLAIPVTGIDFYWRLEYINYTLQVSSIKKKKKNRVTLLITPEQKESIFRSYDLFRRHWNPSLLRILLFSDSLVDKENANLICFENLYISQFFNLNYSKKKNIQNLIRWIFFFLEDDKIQCSNLLQFTGFNHTTYLLLFFFRQFFKNHSPIVFFDSQSWKIYLVRICIANIWMAGFVKYLVKTSSNCTLFLTNEVSIFQNVFFLW